MSRLPSFFVFDRNRCCFYGIKDYEKITNTEEQCFICSNCNNKSQRVVLRRDSHFTICFIKLCRISKGDEIYVCKICKIKRNGIICQRCGCMDDGSTFCSRCGNNKVNNFSQNHI